MRSRLLPFGALVVLALFCSQEAAAQGRGRPKAPKTPKGTTPAASSAAPVRPTPSTSAPTGLAGAVSPGASMRQFGSWLDDASAGTGGEGRTGIGIGYWRLNSGSQWNVPMFDVGYAFTDRVQASANVPFYRSSYEGGTALGVDDMYLSGKVTLIDPSLTLSEFGLAVSPVIEVLSPGTSDGRVHYAVPVSIELRRQPFRVFGSGGYFSRGSLFAAGAVEWSSPAGYVATVSVSRSISTAADTALDALGMSRHRADLTGSVAHPLGRVAAAYVSVGRSLTSVAEGGTSFSVAGGLSFRFTPAKAVR
jgi:hypothetical protein